MVLSFFFFFKQKTAYEMRISDWSSDVCSSDLCAPTDAPTVGGMQRDAGNHTGTKKPAPVRVSCELGGIVGRPETGIWCRHPGSNWGPTAYKAVALPTE